MTRVEAIRIMEHYDDIVWQDAKGITCGKLKEAFDMAMNALKIQWHKASEELPEPLTYVIVRFSNNTMAVSQRTNHFIGETTTVKVTHWIELPEITED